MADTTASFAAMPAVDQTADLGRGYTITNVGSRYYGLYAIRHDGLYIGTAQSRGEVADKIEQFERETPRESGYEEPSHADQ